MIHRFVMPFTAMTGSQPSARAADPRTVRLALEFLERTAGDAGDDAGAAEASSSKRRKGRHRLVSVRPVHDRDRADRSPARNRTAADPTLPGLRRRPHRQTQGRAHMRIRVPDPTCADPEARSSPLTSRPTDVPGNTTSYPTTRARTHCAAATGSCSTLHARTREGAALPPPSNGTTCSRPQPSDASRATPHSTHASTMPAPCRVYRAPANTRWRFASRSASSGPSRTAPVSSRSVSSLHICARELQCLTDPFAITHADERIGNARGLTGNSQLPSSPSVFLEDRIPIVDFSYRDVVAFSGSIVILMTLSLAEAHTAERASFG